MCGSSGIFGSLRPRRARGVLRSYDRVPFSDEEADPRRALSLLPIARPSIDQNGLGMHIAEHLRRGCSQAVPEAFTNESTDAWASHFKMQLRRKDILLRKDRELVAQIHSVGRQITAGRRPSFEVERDEVGRGNADRFGAVAPACRKERGPMPGAVPEIGVRVLG